ARPPGKPLGRRTIHREPVEAETKAEERHDEHRAHDVPAVKVSGGHAATVPTDGIAVSPLSDVIVSPAPGGWARVLGSIHRGQSPGSRFTHVRSRAPRARPSLRRALLHRCADDPDLL